MNQSIIRSGLSFMTHPLLSLRNASIKSKLLMLVTTSVAVALLLAFVGMAINDIRFFRIAKIDQLQSQAKMLGFNSAGVLTFQDKSAAEELLGCMTMYPTVQYACIYNETGNVFAEYHSASNKENATSKPKNDSIIEVRETVFEDGDAIGSVYLQANTFDLSAHIQSYLFLCCVMMIGCLSVAGCFAYWMQRNISAPVKELSDAAINVKRSRDFSVRVRLRAKDELGELGEAFNSMLDEIQDSKAALQKANDELEDRVARRTTELTNEIDQRKKAQEDLEAARDEAEAASRAKSEFLANMSHEIRTPLNGILGFTELLYNNLEENDSPERKEYLETISSSGKHLLELINDILDLSKIEAGQMEVDLSPCSPHDVINQVVSVLRARAQQKGLDLHCEWSSRVPESIVTDGGRLRQLLMNLVGNAIKFTKQGSVTIDAELDHFREMLTIRVVDTGIGIEKEKQVDIFSPFVQADNSVTRRYGGTGLGLAISRRLSAALGGELEVQSELGEGSVFILKVRTGSLKSVTLLDAPPADALRGAIADPLAEEILLPKSHILLVEDGEINRKLVRIILEEAGAQVSTAENGWAAVNATQKHDFDLILMDMQMPVMDGYTAATRIRENGCTTPIVALTAHAMIGDEEKCLYAGCTAYLTKPIQQQQLLEAIRTHLPLACSNSVENASKKINNIDQASQVTSELKSSLPLENPIYREIVEEFVDFLEKHVEDMHKAYQSKDFDSLAKLAHALKGAGGTAGFDSLTEPASKLQNSATTDIEDQIESSLNELSQLTRRIRATPQRA